MNGRVFARGVRVRKRKQVVPTDFNRGRNPWFGYLALLSLVAQATARLPRRTLIGTLWAKFTVDTAISLIVHTRVAILAYAGTGLAHRFREFAGKTWCARSCACCFLKSPCRTCSTQAAVLCTRKSRVAFALVSESRACRRVGV